MGIRSNQTQTPHQTSGKMTVERVYIGGLDPSRLTAQEIMDRLQTDVQNQVELREISVSKGSVSYCHFGAVSLQNDRTALEILRKLYNNVKWKGCKIKVEEAKPHFLERLAKQHQERDAPTQQANATEAGIIPRHLKIRKGHGEESWKVDTKPCKVKDWSAFSKMRQKLLLKKQQQQEKEQELLKKQKQQQSDPTTLKGAYWNRAVHLRFDEDAALANLQSPSSNCTIESSSSSSSEEEQPRSKSGYIWSDDSDDDSSSASEKAKPRATRQAYEWSDDDDESSKDGSVQGPVNPITQQVIPDEGSKPWQKLVHDEFADGIHDEDGNDVASAPGSETANGEDPGENGVEMQLDVQANLKLLGELFPELAGRKAVPIKEKEVKTVPSGWGSTGQMLRFDPTKQSAGQYLLEKPKDDSGSSDESEKLPMKEDSGRERDIDSEDQRKSEEESSPKEEQEPEIVDSIYEEGELEQVFRGAREQVTAAPATNGPTNEGFSFGFQLEEEPKSKDDKGAFSFSFSVPEVAERKDSAAQVVENAEPDKAPDEPKRKRSRRGLFFSEEDMDHYVNLFYSLNDGKRMREDPEGFRSDRRVQESWEKQRRILTEDWKRKRKYAQAQRKKRFSQR
jgi:hypothetical protein